MTDQIILPDDQDQFKLNEVCKLANVQPYMLRFWGTEFPQLEADKERNRPAALLEGPGRADPRDPPPALRRRADHRRRPQEGDGDGMGEGNPRPRPRKRSKKRPRKGGTEPKRSPRHRRPAAPVARLRKSPPPPRLTKRPRPTYNHCSRRSRRFARRSTRSSRSSRRVDLLNFEL